MEYVYCVQAAANGSKGVASMIWVMYFMFHLGFYVPRFVLEFFFHNFFFRSLVSYAFSRYLSYSSENIMVYSWSTEFLKLEPAEHAGRALIILNQPFTIGLLERIWASCKGCSTSFSFHTKLSRGFGTALACWRACADGGANRLYDILPDATREK